MPQASSPLQCSLPSVLQDGLDINGMEGTLVEVIEKYQGKTLSANLPYKTQFMIPKDDGRDMKLIVHLVRKFYNVTHYCHAVSSLHGATIPYLKPVYGMTLGDETVQFVACVPQVPQLQAAGEFEKTGEAQT